MIRLLHLSDVHINAEFSMRSVNTRSLLKNAMRDAFSNAIQFAIDHKVDVVLIAGDLIDFEPISFQMQAFIKSKIQRCIDEKIHFMLCTGNHDYQGYGFLKVFFDNYYFQIFSEDMPLAKEIIAKDNSLFRVIGIGHNCKGETRNLIKTFPVKNESQLLTIGIAHANVLSNTTSDVDLVYLPTQLDDIKKLNYDYFALGHVHTRMFYSDKIAYSGCIQGQHINESGPKGGIFCEIYDTGIVSKAVNFHVIEFQSLTIELNQDIIEMSHLVTYIENRVQDVLVANQVDESRLILRVVMKGATQLYSKLMIEDNILFLEQDIVDRKGIVACEIVLDSITPMILEDDIVKMDNVYSLAFQLIENIERDNALINMLSELDGLVGRSKMELFETIVSNKNNLKNELKRRMVKE